VIYVPHREQITAKDIRGAGVECVQRLLIRTDTAGDLSFFPEKYSYLHPDVGEMLAEKGVKLLGVDVPSVDFVDSKTLDAHHVLHQNGVHILENVVLNHVGEGMYDLIALPLPIRGADGCPVRAVLKKKEDA
jgi:arylformamidase